MAYIGKKVEETELDNRTVDTMTGDGSDTTMSLSATPISVNNVLVFLNGVMQRPTTDFTLSGSTITFDAAPFTGAVVVAITGEGGHIGRPSSPLPTEKFMNSAVTNAKISGVAASKLTGSLPALDGAALTGGPDGYTESTSDPAIDTNPSTGVGTFWVNKSSGEAFCLTDATAGANIWTNVGSGSGDVQPYVFQGTSYGYAVGDQNTPSNVIDKYSYTSQANATDVGDLTSARGRTGGHKSETHGWASGGGGGSTIIEKWAFASDGNSVDSNKDLSTATRFGAGASSGTHGFSGGGSGPSALHNVIGKFSFSDGSNATDIGDLTVQRERSAGHSSSTHGYMAGGSNFDQAGGITNVIDKYSFSSNGNATDVGDITTNRAPDGGGTSSETHGFTNGGHSGVGNDVTIDKYSFASNNNATDVGDMAVSCRHPVSTSATAHGYFAGGFNGAPVNNIQRYAYASTANSTDWADLTVARLQGCSSQV